MPHSLLTGANGFVGKNLSLYLNKQNQCELEILSLRGDWSLRIEDNIASVIHLAGKAHDLKTVSQPEEYYQVNYELTKQLYDAFLKSEAKKFIFISTVKAVADHLDEPLT